jgi:hypothetical protein
MEVHSWSSGQGRWQRVEDTIADTGCGRCSAMSADDSTVKEEMHCSVGRRGGAEGRREMLKRDAEERLRVRG